MVFSFPLPLTVFYLVGEILPVPRSYFWLLFESIEFVKPGFCRDLFVVSAKPLGSSDFETKFDVGTILVVELRASALLLFLVGEILSFRGVSPKGPPTVVFYFFII
jgi:hypothetical protein